MPATSASGVVVVMAQLNLWVGDIHGNTTRIIEAACAARDEHAADVVVFPELALTAYPPEDLLLRPGLRRRVDEALTRIRESVSGVHLVLGYPEYGPAGAWNAACVLRDGERVANYRKHRLPNYSVFDEVRYFRAGEEAGVFSVNGVCLGLSVCEDIWEPAPTALAAAAGARVLLNINASPYHLDKGAERGQVLAARAQENDLPIVYVNAVGGQDELVFDGESLVCDASGNIVFRAAAFDEGLFPVRLDGDGRPVDLPAPVRQPLAPEASVYQALTLGVRDYVNRNGFPGVVVGLSGGIDSALTLAIAVDALGADRVEAVMMPSRYTATISLEDARAEAQSLGVHYHEISIEKPFQAMLDALAPRFKGYKEDLTEENIQARCRGVLLMAISNKTGNMVLTTGNKSEMAVGYATLYGDMVGGFAPLKDVAKLMVYRLSRYRNTLGPAIPGRVIERPPSAELRADQQDSDSLPPYEVLDPILEALVEQDRPVAEVVALGFVEEDVRRVAGLVKRNEYKRRQAPPGVKISRRAFGRDRRYPITSGY